MKTYNTYFDSLTQFLQFVEQPEIAQRRKFSSSILIQIFSGVVSQDALQELQFLIKRLLPEAIVAGATTAGEINNGRVSSNKIAISLSFFEKTKLHYFSYQHEGETSVDYAPFDYSTYREDEITAEKLAHSIQQSIVFPDTKGILLLTSYPASQAAILLKKINKLMPGVRVFGGVAGDNLQYENSLVVGNDLVSSAALVAVAFSSEDLFINTEYYLNWQTIGKVFTVTDSHANVIKSIDHVPAAEIYNKYLGDFTLGGALEFPLIFNKNGTQVARVPSGVDGKQTITIGTSVEVGDQFQFSYGHLESILSKNDEMIESISKYPAESIYVYSCAARRSFLQESAELETMPLNEIATNVGFFTYGEFHHNNCCNQLLNETMTLVMLSESPALANRPVKIKQKRDDGDYVHKKFQSVLRVMNRLISQVTAELNDSNTSLNAANEELSTLLEEVRKSSMVIENKNKNITDSIQYAKRIQTAILPSFELMGKCMPENFIFLKPKDIVSGDFFWIRDMRCSPAAGNSAEVSCDMNSKVKKLIFAAADCTGHGVPGAFMSMLGIAFLNEIVNRYAEQQTVNDIQPNEILTELRAKIKASLHQTGKEGESKDGMDISLCIYDSSQNILEYAGANSPLWIVRRNNDEPASLLEFKADKMPIGIYLNEQDEFTKHTIQLQKGDTAYLFSDGFEDQFGGEKGRKFLSKNFKQLLLDINSFPMDQQKKLLEQRLNSWMGDRHEQVDDILVLGLRF